MASGIIKTIPRKILIIKPSSLGDVVHSLPFLQAIKDAFPKAQIHWIIARGLEGMLETHPMVNNLWIINKDLWKHLGKVKATLSEIRLLYRGLKFEGYDLVVDLQGLLRSGVLTYATRAPLRVGFREAREGSTLFYTHVIRGGKDIHAVDRYLRIAEALGGDTREVNFPMPLIKESENVQRIKKEIGRYGVLIPGARWETKRWSCERFGALASMLDLKHVVVGSTSDSELSEEIEQRSGGKALSVAGKTDLRELISLIRDAQYVISNDSGPLHIAAAFGIPAVALFGPTSPVRTGPYGSYHITVKADVPCAPCYKKNCRTMRCMKEISVEAVYEAVRTLLIRRTGHA